MSYDRAIQLIWDIEKNIDVTKLTFEDIHIWPLLRIAIYNENLELTPPTVKTSTIKKIKSALNILFEGFIDKKNNLKKGHSDFYLSSHTTSRTCQIDEKWHDFIFSPLAEWIKQEHPKASIYYEEFAPGGEYRAPRYEKTAYFTLALVKIHVLGRFFPEKESATLNHEINKLIHFIQTKGGSCESLQTQKLMQRLSRFKRLTNYFNKKLIAIKPRILFIVTYYSIIGMALLHASRKRGIKSVDIQHGVQGAMHVAYGVWDNIPFDGYSCLPDFFWVWSENENKTLKIANPRHQVIVAGNIQQFYWQEKRHPLQKKLLSVIEASKKTTIILVSLQPVESTLVDEIVTTIKNNRFPQCFWLFRLHPCMNKEWDSHLDRKLSAYPLSCEYKISSELPLPSVLNIISGHVTLYSSVTIEAAAIGISTLLYHDNCPFFPDLESSNKVISKKPQDHFEALFEEYLSLMKKSTAGKFEISQQSPFSVFMQESKLGIANR
ncbi:hypothetical protein [Thiothrix subterranea]|uniref:Capsule biosynthesis protein n=1 Tax=Thiothrix subterranea TaxID=2735563 RepID=A0AA51MUF3_9GAMM|nr:hypothetical protein [Thiothrix subterranea]WML88576.1 hypothetical protein RCG00_09405 [Thiothrix subterranea]